MNSSTPKTFKLDISNYQDLVSLHLFDYDIGHNALYTEPSFTSKEEKTLPYYIYNENGTHLVGLVSPTSSPLFLSNLVALSIAQDPIIIHVANSDLTIDSPLYSSLTKYKHHFKTLTPDYKFNELFEMIHRSYNRSATNTTYYMDQDKKSIESLYKIFYDSSSEIIDYFRSFYLKEIKNHNVSFSNLEEMINSQFSLPSIQIFNKFKHLLEPNNTSYKSELDDILKNVFSIFERFRDPVNNCLSSFNIIEGNDSSINGISYSIDIMQKFRKNLIDSVKDLDLLIKGTDLDKLQLSEEFNQFLFMAVTFEFYYKFQHLSDDSKYHYNHNKYLLSAFTHYYDISHYFENSNYITANLLVAELSPTIDKIEQCSSADNYLLKYQEFIRNIQKLLPFDLSDYNEVPPHSIKELSKVTKLIENFVETSVQHLEEKNYVFSDEVRIAFKQALENNFVIGIIQNNLDEESFPTFHQDFRLKIREEELINKLYESDESNKKTPLKRKI